jgi:hypothetical protein
MAGFTAGLPLDDANMAPMPASGIAPEQAALEIAERAA